MLLLQLVVLLGGIHSNPARAANANRIALLVSARNGKNESPLQYTQEDVQRMKETLSLVSNFSVMTLSDPDQGELEKKLDEIQTDMINYRKEHDKEGKQESFFLFYYSGHGGAGELHSKGKVISSHTLYQRLQDFKADVKVGIIDACYSGSFAKGNKRDLSVSDLHGTVVLASSGPLELSHEDPDWMGSLFTHHVVSGLSGAADRDGDGYVEFEELYDHVAKQAALDVEKSGRQRQTPEEKLKITGGSGALVLATIPKELPLLEFSKSKETKTCLVSATGTREPSMLSRSSPERDVHVALPPGQYLLKCTSEGRQSSQQVLLSLKPGKTLNTSTLAFEDSKGGSPKAPVATGIADSCDFDISVQYLYVERDQRTSVSNLEGLLELQGRFSAAGIFAPPYPSASSVVTAGQGQTVWVDQFITHVVVDKAARIPLTADLREIEYGLQGEDDEGHKQATLELDCGRPRASVDLHVPISADTPLEKSGSVVVRYEATRR